MKSGSSDAPHAAVIAGASRATSSASQPAETQQALSAGENAFLAGFGGGAVATADTDGARRAGKAGAAIMNWGRAQREKLAARVRAGRGEDAAATGADDGSGLPPLGETVSVDVGGVVRAGGRSGFKGKLMKFVNKAAGGRRAESAGGMGTLYSKVRVYPMTVQITHITEPSPHVLMFTCVCVDTQTSLLNEEDQTPCDC